LTSASLIRNSGDENNIVENLRVSAHYSAIACSFKVLLKSHHLYHFQIEVLLPSSTERINGTLEHYDLHYNVALVSVKNHYDLRPANTLPSRPKWCSDVAAVGRCFESSALMAMSGKLISSRSALDCLYLVHSSCKITKVIICFCIAYFFMVSK
jgi:small nuclear ribonucleoprotein (snRNP)-like protein